MNTKLLLIGGAVLGLVLWQKSRKAAVTYNVVNEGAKAVSGWTTLAGTAVGGVAGGLGSWLGGTLGGLFGSSGGDADLDVGDYTLG